MVLLCAGDQVLCCRRADFNALGGFAPLCIMEDADLCVRAHEAGPSPACALGYWGRGRIRQLEPPVHTSGRRLEAWGNVYGTYVHFRISVAWYLGASPERLRQLYDRLYTDLF